MKQTVIGCFFSEHSVDIFIVVRNSTHLLYLVYYEQQKRENSTSSTKSEEKQEKSFDCFTDVNTV